MNKCLQEILSAIGNTGPAVPNRNLILKQQFIEFIELHSRVKQLSAFPNKTFFAAQLFRVQN